MGMQHNRGICPLIAALAAGCLLALPSSAQPASDADAAEQLVREVWYEGLPLERAAALDAAGVARLIAMLEDPDEREHHANILIALAASGQPGAYDAIASWARLPRSGEIERPDFRAWQVLPHALGELARHDARALVLLDRQLEGISPGWHFRHHRGAGLRRQAQRFAATGLARSGRPEAQDLLQRAERAARDDPSFRAHLGDCRRLHRELQERGR